MRKHGRVDKNQTALVQVIRQMGATWLDLSSVGGGCPDGLVGWKQQTYLCEIKGLKGTLTPDQEQFVSTWRGSAVHILRTTDDVVQLLKGIFDGTINKRML